MPSVITLAGSGRRGSPVPPGTGEFPRPHPARRLLCAVLAAVAAVGLAVLGPAAPARAHAQILLTNPANGARLAQAPSRLTMRFDEPTTLVDGGIQVLGPAGQVKIPGTAHSDTEIADQVDVPLPPGLGPGAYTVVWRVISVDSHPVHGAFVFAVGDTALGRLPAAGAAGGGDPAVTGVFGLMRGLGYLGLALLAGGVGFLALCWPAGWTHPGTRRILAAGWAASLVSAVGVLVLQGPYGAGRSLAGLGDPGLLTATLATDFGHFVLARILLVVTAGVLLYPLIRRGLPGRGSGPATEPAVGEHPDEDPRVENRLGLDRLRGRTAAGLLLIGLSATWVGTGHAIADSNPLGGVSDVLHVSAMAAWFGGLVFLAGVVQRRSAALPAAQAWAALARFSRIAFGCVVVLVVTGSYKTWREVGSTAAFTGSAYGALLLFKLAIVSVLLWFGAMSRSALHRRLTQPAVTGAGTARRRRQNLIAHAAREEALARQLRWSVRAEVGFAVLVLSLTTVLVATPPGSRPGSGGGGARTAEIALPGGGKAEITLDPALAGPTSLVVTVLDAKGAVWDVPEVRATLDLPTRHISALKVVLVRRGPGDYGSQGLIIPAKGQWQLALTVRTTDIDESTVRSVMRVG